MYFTTWLKTNRKTLTWASSETGMAISTLSRIVRGEMMPSLDYALRLVVLTKNEVSPQELLREIKEAAGR